MGMCRVTSQRAMLENPMVMPPVRSALSFFFMACRTIRFRASTKVVRAVMLPWGAFLVYVDNVITLVGSDSQIASGVPGVSVSYAPAGNTVPQAQLGPLDSIAPNAISAASIGVSAFPNRVELQWQGVTDDPNGTGIVWY